MSRKTKEKNKYKHKKNNNFTYDKYSMFYLLLDTSKISKYESSNDYYLQYIRQYKLDGLKFKLNRFYGFNFPAFFMGPLFYMYNGLFLGLFVNLILTLLVFNIISSIIPSLLTYLPVFVISNIICAFLANYFMIIKHKDNINKSIKYTDDLNLARNYIEKMNIKFKSLNLLLSIPYSVFIFYLMFFILNPINFINPSQAIDNINSDIAKDVEYFIKKEREKQFLEYIEKQKEKQKIINK